MTKKLNLILGFLLLCCVPGLNGAWADDEHPSVARPRSPKEALRPFLPKLNKVSQATKLEDLGLSVMSVDDFFAKNERINKNGDPRKLKQMKNYPWATDFDNYVITWKPGLPNYGALTKGIPYIFFGEHHNTNALPQEVMHAIKEIQHANPGAHILLAVEFAEMSAMGKSPLIYAGEPIPDDIYIDGREWESVINDAKKRGIDVLALDEAEYYFPKEGSFYIKLGNTLVSGIAKDKRKFQELSGYTTPYEMFWFAAVSPIGVNERTLQWVRYLKAVRPFYDIIIVAAGKGHIQREELATVDLVGYFEPSIYFALSTNEELPPVVETVYAQGGQKREKCFGDSCTFYDTLTNAQKKRYDELFPGEDDIEVMIDLGPSVTFAHRYKDKPFKYDVWVPGGFDEE